MYSPMCPTQTYSFYKALVIVCVHPGHQDLLVGLQLTVTLKTLIDNGFVCRMSENSKKKKMLCFQKSSFV